MSKLNDFDREYELALGNRTDYTGYANKLPLSDKRLLSYLRELQERGFDSTETWSLREGIAKFIEIRTSLWLSRGIMGTPADLEEEEWRSYLIGLQAGMEIIANDDIALWKADSAESVLANEAIDILHERFWYFWD